MGLAAAVGVLGFVASGHASTNNLLVNGDFASGLSGWSTYTDGGWVSAEIPGKLNGTTPTTWPNGWPAGAGTNAAGTGPLYDGTTQLTCGKSGGGGSYCWQIVAAAENVEYTLTVQGGAENWWLPSGEIRLIFQDASSAELGRSVVTTTDSIHNPDQYDVGVPYQNWTNSAVAPVGTKFLKVELCNPVGTGSTWFDNASLTAPIDPPAIANVNPDGTRLLNTNRLTFNATSATPINASGIQVLVNGVDVSGSLTLADAGTPNVSVTYSGLQSNRVYAVTINVTDTANLTSFKNFTFDTFAPSFTWEAEDYDFTDGNGSGQFINNPVLSSGPMAGSYYDQVGTEGIDYHDRGGNGDHHYRFLDRMATSTTGDIPRRNYVTAGVADYNIGWFDGAGFSGDNVGINSYQESEWVNYTRTFASGVYHVYARIASGNGPTATVPLAQVLSGQGTTEQVTTNLGAFVFPANGWGSYAYVPLTDRFGNLVKVTLAGTQTLRVSAGSGANVNFFLLLPANSEQPLITDVYPEGRTLLQGTNQMRFTVSSAAHAIPQNNVTLTLNGVANPNLSFSGTTGSWNVSAPLATDVTNYTAVIQVTDDAGNTHATTLYFDTFSPASFLFEAEDWDFDNGQFINSPVITSVPQADSYFEKIGGTMDAFEGPTPPPATAPFRYRSLDALSTDVCTDTPTRALVAAQLTNPLAFNYNLAYWSSGSWANYTRTYPTGNFYVYGRLSGESGVTNSVAFDRVAPTAQSLGTFTFVGRGYNNYDWIPLRDPNNGQLQSVSLSGVATLRATSQGGVNPNSYLLVPVPVAPPTLQASYAAGVLTLNWTDAAFHLQAQTNAPGAGLSGAWSDYPGGNASPVTVPVNAANGSVFFRLSK